jgi:hypothetical protein
MDEAGRVKFCAQMGPKHLANSVSTTVSMLKTTNRATMPNLEVIPHKFNAVGVCHCCAVVPVRFVLYCSGC